MTINNGGFNSKKVIEENIEFGLKKDLEKCQKKVAVEEHDERKNIPIGFLYIRIIYFID